MQVEKLLKRLSSELDKIPAQKHDSTLDNTDFGKA